jgi:hypothetical protein
MRRLTKLRAGHIRVGHLLCRQSFYDSETLLYARDVLGRGVDQQVDVFRRSRTATGNDGKAADQYVARPGIVQGATDSEEVFDLRLACVRGIVRVIRASASSKLAKR